MDFGIYLRREKTYPKMLELAQKAEELGFHSAFLNDHVLGLSNSETEEYLESWTVMTGIGVKTSKLRVGQSVLFNSLRNPAFLAKSIATLDQMTNGRYELMIGAGWNEREYFGYDLMEQGRGMPEVDERVRRLGESVKILNLMLNEPKIDFNGDFWKLKEAVNLPQPIQKPMRISIGCKGERLMGITVRNATGINLSGRNTLANKELIERFEKVCSKNGKSPSDFYVSGFTGLQIASNEEVAWEMQKKYANVAGMSFEDAKRTSYIGTTDDLIEKIGKTRDLGFNMMIYSISGDDRIEDPVTLFHDTIMNSFR